MCTRRLSFLRPFANSHQASMTSCVDVLVSPAAHAVDSLAAVERRPVYASQRVETMRDLLLTPNTPSTSVGKTLISTTRFVTLHGTTDPFPLHAPSTHDPPTDLALALAAMVQPGLVFRDEPSAAILPPGCLSARLTAHRTSAKPSGRFSSRTSRGHQPF